MAEGRGTSRSTWTRAPAGFRTLPHNIEAEQALLGAILINNHGVATRLWFPTP